MKSIHWFELCMLLGSYNCTAVSPSPTAGDPIEEKLVPLELPPGYEDRVKSLVPELLNRLGIPSGLVLAGSGLLSSVSNLSNGFGYFKSKTNSEQDSACKSKLVEDRLELTKYGILMCEKRCLNESKRRASFMRRILEKISRGNDEKRKEADIEVQTEKKAYECVLNGDRYDCLCMKNEILKVTPSLKSSIYQLFKFQGGDKLRGLIPEHIVRKILILILLFLAEKSIEAVAGPVLIPLKLIYHVYRILQWIT